jgi:hypothetical protein
MSVHNLRGGQMPSGPTDGGSLEARIAKLEAITDGTDKRLSLIETDIRAIGKKLDTHFYITWGGIIGLAGIMAKGFGWF